MPLNILESTLPTDENPRMTMLVIHKGVEVRLNITPPDINIENIRELFLEFLSNYFKCKKQEFILRESRNFWSVEE